MPSAICSVGFSISGTFLLVNDIKVWGAILIVASFICAMDAFFDSTYREVKKDKTP